MRSGKFSIKCCATLIKYLCNQTGISADNIQVSKTESGVLHVSWVNKGLMFKEKLRIGKFYRLKENSLSDLISKMRPVVASQTDRWTMDFKCVKDSDGGWQREVAKNTLKDIELPSGYSESEVWDAGKMICPYNWEVTKVTKQTNLLNDAQREAWVDLAINAKQTAPCAERKAAAFGETLTAGCFLSDQYVRVTTDEGYKVDVPSAFVRSWEDWYMVFAEHHNTMIFSKDDATEIFEYRITTYQGMITELKESLTMDLKK